MISKDAFVRAGKINVDLTAECNEADVQLAEIPVI